ncbi:protein NRT1/ PTR FAMILY 5.6-like [Salvia hispanica]|uniref:protein NRT1/ PTR FAMILY 5.6-like n=1 Tax=Salvia hispanica TaxID=49212 RepID=UPI002009AC8F|nr:protein NRT1/ PTR FAMILY 5.6-like [Salvia hispanica]XP_047978228.1 protein NRT1/ PTR FAMILY 5.6-like [Salvia hispanica]
MFNCIRNCFSNSIRDNVKGCRIVQLLWSDTLMRRAFFVLQPFLTDVWKLSFTHAAAIVNIWEGTSLMLPAVFQLLADKYLGNFVVVVISTASSTLGIVFVTMSLPPVLGMGPCKEYNETCVGNTQRGLLYLGVALTAIGRGGLTVSVPCLHDEQTSEGGQFYLCGLVQKHGSTAENLCVYAIGLVIISLISSWTFRFGFPAIFAAIVTVTFLGGWSSYTKTGPKNKGSLLATLLKVFAPCRFYQESESSGKESSFMRHITGISINFIILGIVSALGNTFFVSQANHMKRKFVFMTIPLAVFQLPMLIAIAAAPCICATCAFLQCVNKYCNFCVPKCLRTMPSILGVALALAHAILCCAVAAAVVKRKHAMWLVFQFYLVACVDVFFRSSIETYYHAQAPTDLRDFHDVYTDFVTGVGYFSSVALVAIVGRVSEGKGSWFGKTVSESRLDRYYWLLAVLATLSLVGFWVMAPFCIGRVDKSPANDDGGSRVRDQSSCCFGR